MRRLIGAVLLLATAGAGFTATGAMAQSGAPAGRLSCAIGAGLAQAVSTQRPLECRFRPRRGPLQIYAGIIRGFALDTRVVGRSLIAWRVYGPYARARLGALNGRYSRPAGRVALVGGIDNGVRLEPRPLPPHSGANVALGVTGFELTLTRPPRKR